VNPGRKNIRFIQGDTWSISPRWKIGSNYVNVTGYTAKMQVRIATTSASVIIEMSTDNGRITVSGIDGMFTVALTSAETTGIPVGNYVYDLEVTSPGGTRTTLLQGGFSVEAEVTQ
jgi:hypothetical protein